MRQKMCALILPIVFLIAPVFSQKISNQLVKSGIEAFYMADFEESLRLLQGAIINEILSDEEQFYAHLYVGFCHIRQASDYAAAQLYFQRAITIDPNLELDPMKIPPDLYDAFISVKNTMLGAFNVISDPLDATVVLVKPTTNQVERKKTPATFQNLVEGSYQIVVSQDGYESYSSQVEVRAGLTETLNVTLIKEKEKSFFSKYWPYGAGVLAASAIILVIASGGDEKTPPSTSPTNLPYPPDRP